MAKVGGSSPPIATMITLIILFIAATLIIGTGIRKEEPSGGILFPYGFGALMTLFVVMGGIFVLMGLGALLMPDHEDYTDYEKRETIQVVAINDGSGIDGHFGLFAGYVHDELNYSFYAKADNGEISLDKVLADQSVLIEDSNKEDGVYIEKLVEVVDCPESWFVIYPCPESENPDNDFYRIHVPPGSVIPQTTLDLE